MYSVSDFDDICAYSDELAVSKLHELFGQPEFVAFISNLFPEIDFEAMVKAMSNFTSVDDIQHTVVKPLLEHLIKKSTTALTASGIENMSSSSALYMSNHRDIVMDPALLQLTLLRHGHISTEIGIGDNLLSHEWIRNFVRINKSFIVKRGLTPRDLARVFSQLSAYIRYTITDKKASVWIAQREGRAKDSNDRTQESILKMFALSGTGSIIDNLRPLNISPLAISYEYDPCDYLKAYEAQRRRDDANFRKAPNEDMISMQTGIMGFKGRVHYTFTPSINSDLDQIEAQGLSRKEQLAAICALCDRRIHASYVIYPVNRMAYSLLTGDNHILFADPQPARCRAKEYLESRLALITDPKADNDFLWKKLLEMYANPLINHIEAKKQMQQR